MPKVFNTLNKKYVGQTQDDVSITHTQEGMVIITTPADTATVFTMEEALGYYRESSHYAIVAPHGEWWPR